jgi:hypothetical protein
MKAITVSLLAAAAFSVVGCSHDEYVYHHRVTRDYDTHHYYHHYYSYSDGGHTVVGEPTHLSNPGAPDTFRAVGAEH